MSRRRRVRASDLAPKANKLSLQLVFGAAALIGLLAYRFTAGDEAAGFISTITAEPSMELPPSAAGGVADRPLPEGLRCPIDQQALSPLDVESLARVNQEIAAGTLRTRGGALVTEALRGGLLRADGLLLYPVFKGGLHLVADRAIVVELRVAAKSANQSAVDTVSKTHTTEPNAER